MADVDAIILSAECKVIRLKDLVSSTVPAVPGIYCLRNNQTGNLYIGSSVNIRRRLVAHLGELRRGIHHSLRMQWAWKTHGEDIIDVVIVELVSETSILGEREQHFISTLQPEYNFERVVGRPLLGKKHSPDTIEKIRNARKGKGLGPRTFSPSHIATLKAAAHRGPLPERRGEKRPESTRQKMSQSAIAKFAAGFVHGAAKPVEINGIRYVSCSAAAAAIGVRPMQIVRAIRRGQGRYIENS